MGFNIIPCPFGQAVGDLPRCFSRRRRCFGHLGSRYAIQGGYLEYFDVSAESASSCCCGCGLPFTFPAVAISAKKDRCNGTLGLLAGNGGGVGILGGVGGGVK